MSGAPEVEVENDRTGMSVTALRRAVIDHLRYTRAKNERTATLLDINHAIAHATRDRLVHRWIRTQATYYEQDVKRIYYLSAEYLLGRQLPANLLNLGLYDLSEAQLDKDGVSMDGVFAQEPDPGLGNGGLGRLAACFMDSLATLELPAIGYGIRYEFGIFRQEIEDGWQVEHPDEWLRHGNPWEIARPESMVKVCFGGRVEHWNDADGRFRVHWSPDTTILGVPYDTPVAGFGSDNNTVNYLRLWSARASDEFDLAVFNDGDYRRAVEGKAISESISKVLYPKDDSVEGKELRLKQQYFFVCCAIADILRRFERTHDSLDALADKVAIQLNDTHPAVAVAEFMRVLVDERDMPWDEAWDVTRKVVSYTNHTLLPEALERWPLDLFGRLLPRHLEIIEEIDRRFQRQVHVLTGGDEDRVHRMAIVRDGSVHMAHLAVVGSHTVNGVAALHSDLLKSTVLKDFADLWPDRFTNVTNGVTPRRWLVQCNMPLTRAIRQRIGDDFLSDLSGLDALLPLADDPSWLEELAAIKRANKERLAAYLLRTRDQVLDPNHFLDVQIKRIHEYKRQLMCCLHVVHLYRKIKFEGADILPRTVLFGGKAAPGYATAKMHVKLIHDVAAVLDADPDTRDKLRLLFVPNYDVSTAEHIIPAADLSEQISMSGKEASGTGNMKFQMNGALTLGTLDGANVEIRAEVGAENFFLFGLDAQEVAAEKARGYHPGSHLAASPDLEAALQLLESGYFNLDRPELHREIAAYVRHQDPYLIAADFASYVACHEVAEATYRDPAKWWPMVARNIARSGKFSSDRSITEYASRIWGLSRTPVRLEE
jgi:starch phosphorylase